MAIFNEGFIKDWLNKKNNKKEYRQITKDEFDKAIKICHDIANKSKWFNESKIHEYEKINKTPVMKFSTEKDYDKYCKKFKNKDSLDICSFDFVQAEEFNRQILQNDDKLQYQYEDNIGYFMDKVKNVYKIDDDLYLIKWGRYISEFCAFKLTFDKSEVEMWEHGY